MTLRALFINEDIGGHRTTHLGLRRWLPEVGVDATFLDLPKAGFARRLGGIQVPGLARFDLDLQPLRAQLLAAAVARRRWARALDDGYDVVHVYTQTAALLSTGLIRRRPTVVATDVSGVQNARLLPYRLPGRGTEWQRRRRDVLEQRVWDAATLAVTKTEWAAASLRDDYGVDADRLRIIRYGVDLPPDPPPRPVAAGALPTIGFIGRSLERKGGLQLLRVFQERLRDRARLVLVTQEAIAPSVGVEVRNDLQPGSDALGQVLRSIDVLAYPSEVDTFGYAVLEAMSYGVPVVAARANAIAELVVDRETGLLVPLRDDGALADALASLVEDPERRRAYGLAGRERAVAMFDARNTSRAVADALAEAVDRWRG